MGQKNSRPVWAAPINALRQQLAWSQSQLARKLDVSAMAVSRWERGVNEPPAHIYIELGRLAINSQDSWLFWERAGLTRAVVRRMLHRR